MGYDGLSSRLKRIRVILEPGVAGLHRADGFGTHFMYRVRIGRLDTNFGGEMLRAEGGEPQKLGTNSLKFQWSERDPKVGLGCVAGFLHLGQIWDPFYL